MAKRKAAGIRRRTTAAGAAARRKRPAARKSAARRAPARKTAGKSASPAARRRTTRTATKTAARSARTRKPSTKRTVKAAKTTKAKRPVRSARKAAAKPIIRRRSAPAKQTRPAQAVARKTPALDRVRRTVQEDEVVPSPPSSLDLDRTASAARTGRQELKERFEQHTETSPALTAGDVDADWESAYSVGDEAPGGDNPTPDQDVVDDIGRAIGVEYEDNEELKGEAKISKRDKHRWELDPASSEDYEDR